MSLYQKLAAFGSKYIAPHKLFKTGFNLSPMYRRSTARIYSISADLLDIKIKIPISYKNRNYMNSIFGGSMFSAVDPIPMIQLVFLLGNDYVIWDKSAEIYFRRPAKESLYAEFICTHQELDEIRNRVTSENEIEIVKTTQLTNQNKSIVYCEVKKTIYIAEKAHYKKKLDAKKMVSHQLL